MKVKRLRLKKWVKVTLVIMVGILASCIIYQDYKKEVVKNTPMGEYTCRGSIVQICGSNKEVADYLGV